MQTVFTLIEVSLERFSFWKEVFAKIMEKQGFYAQVLPTARFQLLYVCFKHLRNIN